MLKKINKLFNYLQQLELPCINCGHCKSVCPMDLQPQKLLYECSRENTQNLFDLGLADCISCNLCDVVCPSNIALGNTFTKNKKVLKAKQQEQIERNYLQQRYQAKQLRKQPDHAQSVHAQRPAYVHAQPSHAQPAYAQPSHVQPAYVQAQPAYAQPTHSSQNKTTTQQNNTEPNPEIFQTKMQIDKIENALKRFGNNKDTNNVLQASLKKLKSNLAKLQQE